MSADGALRIGVIGVNFKTAPLSFIETITKGVRSLAGEKGLFFFHPTVLLSTCNRVEIYFSAPDLSKAHGDLLTWLRVRILEPFEHKLYSYFGMDCFAHLAKVASGLDSAILVESDIQRQVRLAYAKSSEHWRLPPCLHFLFQKSLQISKSVRTLFGSTRKSPTLFGILWQLGQQELGDFKEKKILLVGYSEIHRGLASFLSHRGVKDITFCTRFPQNIPVEGAVGREVLHRWRSYDCISCASPSEEFLISGRGNGQLIFDLSVPRNVDPSTQGVALYNIEQIGQLIEQGRDSIKHLEEHLYQRIQTLNARKKEINTSFVALEVSSAKN